jgi:hypothetical protein
MMRPLILAKTGIPLLLTLLLFGSAKRDCRVRGNDETYA